MRYYGRLQIRRDGRGDSAGQCPLVCLCYHSIAILLYSLACNLGKDLGNILGKVFVRNVCDNQCVTWWFRQTPAIAMFSWIIRLLAASYFLLTSNGHQWTPMDTNSLLFMKIAFGPCGRRTRFMGKLWQFVSKIKKEHQGKLIIK